MFDICRFMWLYQMLFRKNIFQMYMYSILAGPTWNRGGVFSTIKTALIFNVFIVDTCVSTQRWITSQRTTLLPRSRPDTHAISSQIWPWVYVILYSYLHVLKVAVCYVSNWSLVHIRTCLNRTWKVSMWDPVTQLTLNC